MLNGILCVNKPEGFTSFDVIAKLRGILKMKRLGHAGTLDPMATGVLPVFVGSATKASSIIPINEKSYIAGFKLGLITDTQDITGKICSVKECCVSAESIEKTLLNFRGKIKQIPPMYSAVSVGGKRLYELARAGIEIERDAREIEIENIELWEYDEKTCEGSLFIACSKGTYVRTIIHDLGLELGCGGAMTSLIRTSSNGITLKECFTLEEIEKKRDENNLEKIIYPVDRLFKIYPKLVLSEQKTVMYKNGVKLFLDRLDIDKTQVSLKYRIYGYGGEFIGIALADYENNILRIDKNLC